MTTKILSPFPYYGGKTRFLKFILPYLPEGNRFVDVFGGSAVVSINVAHQYKRIVYNDIHEDLVNFFRVLRDHRDILIEKIKLTPAARDELKQSYNETDDKIEQARRTFVKIRQSFSNKGIFRQEVWSAPYNENRSVAMESIKNEKQLFDIARIIKRFDIENKDWRFIVKKYGTKQSVIFADPPYDLSVRTSKTYKNEMNENDHKELAKALTNSPSKCFVCGYRSCLYDEIYTDWERIDYNSDARSAISNNRNRTESLWIKH